MKLVAALSKRGMAPEDFLSLESSLQLELWEHCNEIIYQMIAKSLGHKYNYLLARVAAGDGMKAYQAIKLLDNESTTGAKNQFLSDLMRLTMRATGTRDTPANMMTYYDKIIELDSKYRLANNGIGVDRDVLRTKLLELPSAYDKAVEFIEQDDAMCRRQGREPMTCQAIVDYVNLFENTKKRKDRQGTNGPHRKLGRRGRALWAQGREQNGRPKPAVKHRSGGNPLRNLRGRTARMAERRVRNGTQSRKEKTCYHCGEAGHFKRDCPKLQRGQPGSKAYKTKTAPVRPPRNHVGLVLRVVPQTSGVPPRALAAQLQQSLVLDSGATGHFVPESIHLENQRPTRKNVQGAGQEVMRGLGEGDLGSLKGVLRVQGLNQGLISVAEITQRHKACVIFSSDRAYLIPQWTMARFLRNAGWVASLQGETGLYHTDPKRVEAAIQRLSPQPKARRMLHHEPDGRALNALATVAARAATMPTRAADGAAESKAGADVGRPPLKRAKTVPGNPGESPSAKLLGKSANREGPPDPSLSLHRKERPRIGISFGGELRPDGVMKCITREEAESAGSAHGTNLPPKTTRRRWTNHRVLMNTEIAREHDGDEATERRQREMEVLVLASTGDLALANLVAARFDVDWNRVREEMKRAKNHWAKKAAHATILTCNKCLLPCWPDCDCCVEADGAEPSVRSHKMERAYNYVDKPPSNPAVLFHRRMGHMTVPRMIQAFKDGGNHGIEGLTIKAIREMPWCPDCAACKQTRKGHSRRAKERKRSTIINEVIHTDTMERTIASLPPGRFTKIQTFVDECTRYLWVRFFRRKTASEFTTMLESFEHQAQIQHRKSVQWKGGPGTPVLSYFSDNASELVARDQKERLAEKLIELKLSTPGESAANGIAERANRTILETTRVLLYQAGLPLPFWHLAANMAVYILNRSPSRNNPGNKSPYELYYGKAPDRSKIRRFGCRCWVWQDKDSRPNRSKLDPTATPMMFAGYVDHNTHGFLVWDPETHQVKVRYSLIFEEDANLGITIGSKIYQLPSGKQRSGLHIYNNVNDKGTPERVDSNPLMLESMADDGWNQIYTADDEETLNDIGRKLGVDPTELQQKNVGVVGSDRKTGLLPLDAPLEKGTELWIPTKIEKEAEPEQTEESSQSEDEAPPEEWKSRLRSRKRRALKVSYEKEPDAKPSMPANSSRGPAGNLRCRLLKTQRDIEDLLTEDDSVPRMLEMIAALDLRDENSDPNRWLHENCAKSAARHNRPKCLRWALGNGAGADTTTKAGNSLLHLAAFTGSAGMCQMLLEHGSDPETVNKRGEKPEDTAKTAGFVDCADLIRDWADYRKGEKVPDEHAIVLTKSEMDALMTKATSPPSQEEVAHALSGVLSGGMAQLQLEEDPTQVTRNRSASDDFLDAIEDAMRTESEPRSRTASEEFLIEVLKQEADQTEAQLAVDSSALLEHVLTNARKAVAIQAQRSATDDEKLEIEQLCESAHTCFARAYMMERMLLVESLKGTPARDIPTPKNFKEAVNSEFADYWNEAIMTEIRNLEAFNTWEWVPRPKDRKLIDSTWAFRVKANQKGEVDRMKARLCARGYREIWGQDYVETHAPVTCLTSWRACLAQAAEHGRKIAILDIKSAYLMADVKEDIYLSPPEGLEVPDNKRGWVLKLKRSLYGLKQAGRCWSQLLNEKMLELGMRPSTADPCLFLNDEDGELMTVNVHVDDCMITYTDERKYQRFRKRLESMFQISKSDDNNTFLGVVIERLPNGKDDGRGPIYVHQKPYITDILARFRHTDCKPASVPAEPGLKLSKAQMPTTDEGKAAMKDVPYRQLVGALLYLANCTRPDIAQAVSSCARFGSNPGPAHWKALKQVLRYLKGTQNLGLVYGKTFAEGIPHNCIHGYVDGDWGGDADDRRSTTGYVFMSYGGPVSWRSKKQASTALSSCESEYMAASEAAKEAIWLTRLYKEDLKIEDVSLETRGDLTEKEYLGAKPLTMFEDNVGCISLSKNPVMHKSSKHIEIRYHFVRERVQDGSLKLVYIPSSENVADILTKSTRKHTFIYLRDKIMSEPHRIVAPSID